MNNEIMKYKIGFDENGNFYFDTWTDSVVKIELSYVVYKNVRG